MPRHASLASLCVTCLLWVASIARAEPEQAKVGFQLELQLLAPYRYHAESKAHQERTVHQSGIELGPLPSEDDFGAQVPVQLGISVVLTPGVDLGLRFGITPTCMKGPETGERGKDVNWQVEPFGRVVLTPQEPIQLYVQGGPFVGHSCVGDTDEGITSGLYGLHLGGGIEHDFTPQLSLNAELRGISAWGEHQLHSHGEVPLRHDGFDLRGQLLIGVSLWL